MADKNKMTDSYKDINKNNDLNERICHVAYTLGDHQPVISTIIGDRPFFYMDEEIDILDEEEDEDGLFSLEDFHALERHLEELHAEETAFDRFSDEFIRTPEQYFCDFCEAKDSILGTPVAQKTVDDILNTLSKSRLALAYIDYITEQNIKFKLSDQISGVQYHRQSGLILINKYMDFADQLLLCARELRHVWQIHHVGTASPLTYGPDDAILVNRLIEADLYASMVRIAWELQLSGERDLWHRIENSCLNDLAHAFARDAFADFRNINNGYAALATFEQWFLSDRCTQADKIIIQGMLENQHEYFMHADKPAQVLTSALIIKLGTMPYGKNYLQEHTYTLLNDPLFKEVRDRSNANFLWFVKFERSFREMEQELHIEDNTSPAEYAHRSASSQKGIDKVQNHGIRQSAEILSFSLSEHRPQLSRASFRSNARLRANKSAEIIYLRRWSGE